MALLERICGSGTRGSLIFAEDAEEMIPVNVFSYSIELIPLIPLIPQNGQISQRFHFIQRAQRSGLRPLRAGFVGGVVGAFPGKIQIPLVFRQITPNTLAGIGNP